VRVLRVPGVDGLRLQAIEWSQDGVAMVLLHGFANSARVWDPVASAVAPFYRTIALDQRGHGDSDRDPEGRYDHATMARDLEAALAFLGIERLVLVGHSMGGRVAMHFAGAHPERMAGLVIVDSGPDLDARGVTRIRLESSTAQPTYGSVAEYEQTLARLYPVAKPETLALLARHWLRLRPDGRFEPKTDPDLGKRRLADAAAQRAAAEAETRHLWDALARVPCPALVIRGAASDVLSPETADRMVDDVLARGTLAVISNASHSVMIDNPEAFEKALTDFVLG
jgi:pimeloyl-ACP methyl ester carboxylesterase